MTSPKPPASWLRQGWHGVQPKDAPEDLKHLRRQESRPTAEIERLRVGRVVDLLLRACELSMCTGASASETTLMALRLADHFEVATQVNLTYTSITISAALPDGDPITSMRMVQTRADDYARLTLLDGWTERVLTGQLDLEQAQGSFDSLTTRPRTYRPSVVALAGTLLGGSMAALIGGNPIEVALAGASTGLVDVVLRRISRAGIPGFFLQLIGGAIPTIVGLVVMTLASILGASALIWPSVIVAAGMASLLAGLSLVGAAQDALDGYHLTAAARTLEVATGSTGIAVGVMGTLWVGLALGVPAYIVPTGSISSRVSVMLVSSALIGVSFALIGHARPLPALTSGLLGALGAGAATLVDGATGNWPLSVGVAAFSIGMLTMMVQGRLRVPFGALASGAIAPLLPGMLIYRGLYGLLAELDKNSHPSSYLLLMAGAVGLALAVGTSAGRLFAARVLLPADHAGRRAARAVGRMAIAQHQDRPGPGSRRPGHVGGG